MKRRPFLKTLSVYVLGALAARAVMSEPQNITVMPGYESDGPGKLPKAGEEAYFFDPHRGYCTPHDYPNAIGAFLVYDDSRFEQGKFRVWARVVGRRGDWAVAVIDRVDMNIAG